VNTVCKTTAAEIEDFMAGCWMRSEAERQTVD
jgi:hypothetical protein